MRAQVATELDARFEARDAAVEDSERALTRSLKRALSDEQNEVLDSLRRLKGTPRIEVLLPEPEVHAARYERVAAGPLATAATVGASAGDGSALVDSAIGETVAVDELARGFADEVATDLRARLERALDGGTADSEALVEAISAGYREWKSARVEPTARHHTAAAYSAAPTPSRPTERSGGSSIPPKAGARTATTTPWPVRRPKACPSRRVSCTRPRTLGAAASCTPLHS